MAKRKFPAIKTAIETLATPFKYVTKKVTEAFTVKGQTKEQTEKQRELLDYWTKQFEIDRRAKQEWDDRFDRWEAFYHGNRVFDNLREETDDTVRTILNLPRMIIESQIDLLVPDPVFKPVAPDDEEAIKSLESQVKYAIRAASPSIEKINLENERRIAKLGGAFFKVHWNNNIERAGYIGDVEISNPHPKDIIPNASATSIDDMEHYHHVVNKTAKYIMRRWPHITLDELEQKASLYEEYDEILGDQEIQISARNNTDRESGLNKYTIIETTYKDEDSNIGKLWWSGDLLISNVPKFFYRHDENNETLPVETIDMATGESMPGMLGMPVDVQYYVPKNWDIIYQPYLPRDKCFWGVSMFEDLKDLQESIKKVMFIEEEKILKGTTKILTDDKSIVNKLQDPLSEIIYTPNLNAVKEIQMGNDSGRGVAWIEMMKDFMQLITGATDPAMGKPNSNVASGRQAQLYIEQSNYKINIKTAYKATSYRQLYRVIADFYMAFADYDRPYRLQGEGGKDTFGVFNRMNMLRDRNGNLVYPDYDIDIGAEAGFLKNKIDIFNMLLSLSAQGKLVPSPDNLMLMRALNKLGVPYLADIIAFMEERLQQAEAMQGQAMQGQIGQQQAMPMQQMGQAQQPGMPVSQQEEFAALPPEIQQQILAQLASEGGGNNAL